MRLSRGRLAIPEPCVYSGIGRPEHADRSSIPEPVGPSMRLRPGIGRPEHASIPEPVDPSMRLSREHASIRLTRACVYPGVDPVGLGQHASIPEHASIPGGRRASVGMRLSRSRDPSMRLSRAAWPKHASIPGSVGLSMRLSRSRLTRACVYPGVGLSMRLSRSRSTRACVYPGPVGHASRPGIGWHASIPGSVPEHASMSMRLSRDRSAGACVYPGAG